MADALSNLFGAAYKDNGTDGANDADGEDTEVKKELSDSAKLANKIAIENMNKVWLRYFGQEFIPTK